MADDFGFFSSSESGAPEAAEEDPAAAFLAQQESEIAGIENDEGFGAPAGGQAALAQPGPASGGESAQRSGNWGGGGGLGLTPGYRARADWASKPRGRMKRACSPPARRRPGAVCVCGEDGESVCVGSS